MKINLKWLPFLKGIIDLCAILVYQIFKKGNIIMKVSEPINVISWLEKQINYTMQEIESDRDDDSLLSILDKYISMKKKYEGSIDHLHETIRVMQDFATFIQEQHPEKNIIVKEMVHKFLHSK